MKTTEDIKRIEQLIERFFDGATTLAEEDRLYRFFASDSVPEELEQYREMFLDFGAMPFDDASGTDAGAVAGVEMAASEVVARPLVVRMWHYVAAAVAAVFIVGGIILANDMLERRDLEARYGGSYVVVNGKRVDDLKKILPQIESTLHSAEMLESRVDAETTIKAAEQHVLDNISDPAERERVRHLLN